MGKETERRTTTPPEAGVIKPRESLVGTLVEALKQTSLEEMPMVEPMEEVISTIYERDLPEHLKEEVQKLQIGKREEWICKLELTEDLEVELFKVAYPKKKRLDNNEIVDDILYRQYIFNRRGGGLRILILKQRDPEEKKSLEERLRVLKQKEPYLEKNLTSEELGAWTEWREKQRARREELRGRRGQIGRRRGERIDQIRRPYDPMERPGRRRLGEQGPGTG
jgi:hypothetical protein